MSEKKSETVKPERVSEAAVAVAAVSAPAAAPARRKRGRKPITDPLHLTPSERRILVYFAGEGEGGASLTKSQLASLMGCNVKTVDHAVTRLRQRGMVETIAQHSPSGGQLQNLYRATPFARKTYPDLLGLRAIRSIARSVLGATESPSWRLDSVDSSTLCVSRGPETPRLLRSFGMT